MDTAATRIVLLPDDTALRDVLAQAEQLLEIITTYERDTTDDDPAEPRPWRLPAPLGRRARDQRDQPDR